MGLLTFLSIKGYLNMIISPESKIYILSNIPIDNTYDHTLYFTNAENQNNYFLSKAKYNRSNYCTISCSYFKWKVRLSFAEKPKRGAYCPAFRVHFRFLLFQGGELLHYRVDYVSHVKAQRRAEDGADKEYRAMAAAARTGDEILFLLIVLHDIISPLYKLRKSICGVAPQLILYSLRREISRRYLRPPYPAHGAAFTFRVRPCTP